ncbi:hypothetical protein HMPREF1214_02107 [Bacteroides sp. HPS0048]|uniref:hypothetical protein n=1 Tax=Bacteroides sp. HPS0048 TaxID=1078089 RepID=UPI00035F268F|nr:hypothetical protein [Bacteroides sp. HPS0048]EOA58535.1 hypothetical protein HMPREF1214_02107 [Bacteroides sp. HPS0048]
MSPFLIFASILTVIYIIYYAANITLDMRKKKDAQNTDEVESFDVSQMNGNDEPIEVTEDGDGFTLSKFKDKLQNITALPNQKTNPKESEEPRQPEAMQEENPDTPNEVTDEDNSVKITFFDNLNEISPEYSVQLERQEFKNALLTKGTLRNLIKIKETRNEV